MRFSDASDRLRASMRYSARSFMRLSGDASRGGPVLPQKLNADEKCRQATDHEADAVASGAVEQARVRERERERTDLAEREHAAGDAAAHPFGRGTRGFREQDAVPRQRGRAEGTRHEAEQDRWPAGMR